MKTKKIGNSSPLGLIGCSITTIMFNMHNAGFFPLNSIILSIGFLYGGIAQIIAGIFEYKKGNTFTATTFISYGLFWESLISLYIIPYLISSEAISKTFLGTYLIYWGILSIFMFLGTLRENFVLQFMFFNLTLLFFLLAIGNLYESKQIITFAGIEGIICGISSFYLAIAELLNEQFNRKIFPIGKNIL